MGVKIDMSGFAELGEALEQYADSLSGKIAAAINLTAYEIQGNARKALNDQSSKVKNPVVRNGRVHFASKPGHAPNSDTGDLARSIQVTKAVKINNKWIAQVEANAKYAAAQEFGNKRLPKRPYMAPALAEGQVSLSARISRIIANEELGG